MKNRILIFTLLLGTIVACSCITHKMPPKQDNRALQYWTGLPDCCVKEIRNDLYAGMILDGKMLSQVDRFFLPNIKSILKMEIDSLYSFDYVLEDSMVLLFERQCLDSSYITVSPRFFALKDTPYYRQYIGLLLNDCPYIFVSFKHPAPHCNSSNKQCEQCYQEFRLIYSRCFIAPGIDFHPNDNTRFWMLYDITSKHVLTYP